MLFRPDLTESVPKKIGEILEKYQSVPKKVCSIPEKYQSVPNIFAQFLKNTSVPIMFAQFLKNTKGLPGSRSYFARPWGGSSYGNLSQVGGDDDNDDDLNWFFFMYILSISRK